MKLPVVDPAVGYKYLGFFQKEKNLQSQNRKRLIEELAKRIDAIIETKLSSRNGITAINETVVSILNYSSGIISWSDNELVS